MKRVIDPRVLSEETILDLLDFRIALEIGISSDIFRKITPKDIEELSEIVKMGIVFENNEYALISESAFQVLQDLLSACLRHASQHATECSEK